MGTNTGRDRKWRLPYLWLWLLVLGWPYQAFSQCLPIASAPAKVVPATYRPIVAPAAGSVRLTYLGHSSFLIESAEGVRAVTDYNGIDRLPEPPAVVTMNNAHSTHYTDFVGPEIEHVLRGWDPDGGIAEHDLTVADMHVRNVPTNVRGFGGTRYNGNSIFVFELADLCIAHLGHLHHVLSDTHLGELGMIDILLVPVDGSYTIAQELMLEVLDQIAAPLIIPMHFFSEYTLARFLSLVEERYEVVFGDSPSVTLSRMTLPYRKVLVLPAG